MVTLKLRLFHKGRALVDNIMLIVAFRLLLSLMLGLKRFCCVCAGNKEQIQEVIKEGLISILVQLYPTAEHEIQKEIGWALANAASGSSTAQVIFYATVPTRLLFGF